MINIVEDWHWWVIGTLLMVFNVFSRNKILIILGLVAIIVGFVLTLDPFFPVKHQLGGFLVLSTVLIFVTYGVFNKTVVVPLNEGPGKELIGKRFILDVPMFEGNGTLNIEGTIWNIEGRDLPKGSEVRVIACRGETLLVVDEKAAKKFEKEKAQREETA